MAENSDILIGGEPINADTIGLDKRVSPRKKKQYIIIGAISVAIVILVVIIVIIATSGKSTTSETDGGDKSPDKDDHDPKNAIGEINLVYQPLMNKATTILSADFDKSTSFSIYEGDKFVKYAKEYNFGDKNKNLKFVIYEDINMDSMFKGVKTLKNFTITSNKNLKIAKN